MLDEKIIRGIFYDALQLHRIEYSVSENEIEKAIIAMQDGYAPKKWFSSRVSEPLNYDNPAYRCGYLHKYASCHASLVQFVLNRIGLAVIDKMFPNDYSINICCVGGGPGTDIIGLCAVFHSLPKFLYKSIHFDIVDCMVEWRKAFTSVLTASFKYGNFGGFLASRITCSYLRADMLSFMPSSVKDSIRRADLVTMVKFVSAAASGATPNMLQDVFTLMKPGAAVLFIDNAGGGFYELVSNTAKKCGLTSFSGPHCHMKYQNEVFKCKMFGYFSLSCTTVSVEIWKKTCPVAINNRWGFVPKRTLDSYAEANSYGCSNLHNPTSQGEKSENHPRSSSIDFSKESDETAREVRKAEPSGVNNSQTSKCQVLVLGAFGSSTLHSVRVNEIKPNAVHSYHSQSSSYSSGVILSSENLRKEFPEFRARAKWNQTRSEFSTSYDYCDSDSYDSVESTTNILHNQNLPIFPNAVSENCRDQDMETCGCCIIL